MHNSCKFWFVSLYQEGYELEYNVRNLTKPQKLYIYICKAYWNIWIIYSLIRPNNYIQCSRNVKYSLLSHKDVLTYQSLGTLHEKSEKRRIKWWELMKIKFSKIRLNNQIKPEQKNKEYTSIKRDIVIKVFTWRFGLFHVFD